MLLYYAFTIIFSTFQTTDFSADHYKFEIVDY